MPTYFTSTHVAVDIDLPLCWCHREAGMHDAFGVCNNHEWHDGVACDENHSTVLRIAPTVENLAADRQW